MDKKSARIRRATRARKKISELAAHRLVVNRTPRHIYAQLIAPSGSEVLAAASTVEADQPQLSVKQLLSAQSKKALKLSLLIAVDLNITAV